MHKEITRNNTRILSAIGSNISPSVEVNLYFLAKKPSKKSVIEARTKIIRARAKLSNIRIRQKIKGAKRTLKIVSE